MKGFRKYILIILSGLTLGFAIDFMMNGPLVFAENENSVDLLSEIINENPIALFFGTFGNQAPIVKIPEEPSFPMAVKYNPTGTQVYEDYLLIRVDIYPTPGQKTYDQQHIQVPVIPPEGYQGEKDKEGNPVNVDDYNKWVDSLPKVWQTNPMLCYFLRADPDITPTELEATINQVFNKDTLKKLDDFLSQSNPDLKQLDSIIDAKAITANKLPKETNIKTIKTQLNTRFSNFEVNVGK